MSTAHGVLEPAGEELSRKPATGRPRWGLAPVLAVLFIAGANGSVVYTAAAATAQSHGHPGAAGWLEAAAAIGGMTGGLLWARRKHRRGRRVHLSGLLATQALTTLAAATVTAHLPLFGLVMALGGAAVAPIYVVAYLAADDLARPNRETEAGTWVNVAGNAGNAGGSALAGLLVQHGETGHALIAAGLVTVLAASVSGMSIRRPQSAR